MCPVHTLRPVGVLLPSYPGLDQSHSLIMLVEPAYILGPAVEHLHLVLHWLRVDVILQRRIDLVGIVAQQ